MNRPELTIDAAAETLRIAVFIRQQLREAGLDRVVLGISGGIDSAVVASLCVRALGKDAVFGLALPYRTSSSETRKHAADVATALGISLETIDITPAVDAFRKMLDVDDPRRLGNLMARARMCSLYDRSVTLQAIVAGTSNRTEWMLGYSTLHGDSACGVAPIVHLYKCHIRQLAAHLGVPRAVIEKAPTADLWDGQTDEAELGFTYDDADWLLFNMLDREKTDPQLVAIGFEPDLIAHVRAHISSSEFKRRLPHSLLRNPGRGCGCPNRTSPPPE